jgi:hypothetical protein
MDLVTVRENHNVTSVKGIAVFETGYAVLLNQQAILVGNGRAPWAAQEKLFEKMVGFLIKGTWRSRDAVS